MKYESKKEIGDFGEQIAVNYLRRRFHRILCRNFKSGKYEIDIISSTVSDLVFTEVKTRTYESAEEMKNEVPPKHAVDGEKQYFTRQAAYRYLHTHPTKKRPRMDVIEVYLEKSKNGKKPKLLAVHQIKAAY